MKIAHVVDDEKFIDHCIAIFEHNDEIENTFFLVAPQDDYKPVHVRKIDQLIIKRRAYFSSDEFHGCLKTYDCLILHCLDFKKIKICLLAPARLKIIWSGWGADYYNWITTVDEQLFQPETIRFLNSRPFQRGVALRALMELAKKILRPLRRRLYLNKLFDDALQRIDYFSSPIPEDYDLLLFLLGSKFRAQYIQLNYGSLKMIMPNGGNQLHGNHILIGNSATPTNNHLDLFKLIKTRGLNGRKIIVPLNYGDKDYALYVTSIGKKWFGEDFEPILEFLPLQEYDSIISQCSTAIMGHRRQQGVGNTIALLYRGARVYLDQANPFYWFLRNRGAHVFTIQELASGMALQAGPLTPKQIHLNREILTNFWGEESVFGNIQRLVEKLQKNHLGD